jgi:hypothetical protein
MLDGDEQATGKIKGKDTSIIGGVEVGEKGRRDGKEREMFNVRVTGCVFGKGDESRKNRSTYCDG